MTINLNILMLLKSASLKLLSKVTLNNSLGMVKVMDFKHRVLEAFSSARFSIIPFKAPLVKLSVPR